MGTSCADMVLSSSTFQQDRLQPGASVVLVELAREAVTCQLLSKAQGAAQASHLTPPGVCPDVAQSRAFVRLATVVVAQPMCSRPAPARRADPSAWTHSQGPSLMASGSSWGEGGDCQLTRAPAVPFPVPFFHGGVVATLQQVSRPSVSIGPVLGHSRAPIRGGPGNPAVQLLLRNHHPAEPGRIHAACGGAPPAHQRLCWERQGQACLQLVKHGPGVHASCL
jgi:hypothetical protein